MPKIILDPAERQRHLQELELISAAPQELTDEHLQLARDLSRIHGQVKVSNEASGIHFYMASPICLEEDGAVELDKCHLAVNVNKYTVGEDMVAMCMKTSTPYNIMDLLSMPPLSQRGYEDKPEVIKMSATREEFMELDANGNSVPKGPGRVTPVYRLPPDHPARVYLKTRGFDPIRLYQQFRLSWGEEERTDMFYRKMLGGFKATPQGRLIFFIDVDGVQRGWQARILEAEADGFRYYWHPYQKAWVKVLRYDPSHPKKWAPVNENWEGFDSVKYLTSHGCRRNECLIGFDAAVSHKRRTGVDYCFFMEGPMDAGRIGPPAMGLIGKSMSPAQFALLRREFSRFVYISDNDAEGIKYRDKTAQVFRDHDCQLITLTPEGTKDLGAMPEAEAMSFAYSKLWTLKN